MSTGQAEHGEGLERARRVKERVEEDLLGIPGVQGVDVGYKVVGGKKTNRIAIRVYVARKRDVAEEERIPPEIEGIPTDVIERRFMLHGA